MSWLPYVVIFAAFNRKWYRTRCSDSRLAGFLQSFINLQRLYVILFILQLEFLHVDSQFRGQ